MAKLKPILSRHEILTYSYNELAKQHKRFIWLVFAVLAFTSLAYFVYLCYNLVFIDPINQVSQITNATEKAILINAYRTSSIQLVAVIAQIFGGIAIFVGLFFAWGNLTTAREGQITDRFTKAVEQLGAIDKKGNPAIEIRLGGIYALERVCNESKKDYLPIMEILIAYVRKNSPYGEVGSTHFKASNEQSSISLDIQAILTVISRRKYSYKKGETKVLNLSLTNLHKGDVRKANLIGANLDGANLFEANLSNANFTGAELSNANLTKADLSDTNLTVANLFRANFTNSSLRWAELSYAVLIGVDFTKADLTGANFTGADFTEANLQGANLSKTKLKEADGLTIEQLSKAKTLYEAKIDDELLIQLKEKYPALFEKPKE